jgi:hypothetical protein
VTFGDAVFERDTELAIISLVRGFLAVYYQDVTGFVWESEQNESSFKEENWTKHSLFRARRSSSIAVTNNPYQEEGSEKKWNNVRSLNCTRV